MAKLVQLSENSWIQYFKDRKKELLLWGIQTDVAKNTGISDKTQRLLRIKFEDQFKIDVLDYFTITSNEISFPRPLIQKIRDIVFNNPESYFTVTVINEGNELVIPSNINHIKNIKRKSHNRDEWAYNEVLFNQPFLLRWGKAPNMKGSASTPKSGEMIALFQKPDVIEGRRNYDVYFTHIVQILTDDVVQEDSIPDFPYARWVRLISKAEPITSFPNANKNFDFFLPNRGATNPLSNVKSLKSETLQDLQEEIWDLFMAPSNVALDLDNTPEFINKEEGRSVHRFFETKYRNSSIVLCVKSIAEKAGILHCRCCGFDFLKKYGIHGKGFIEAHHKIHLNKGERITNESDLALVCSNCHRMLHRRQPNGGYLEVEELRELIEGMTRPEKAIQVIKG